MLKDELIALPKGAKVKPKEVTKKIENYVHRADATRALRQRLTKLSEQGKFRMIDSDEWERM